MANFATDCRGTLKQWGCSAGVASGYCPKAVGMLKAGISPKKERSWQEETS